MNELQWIKQEALGLDVGETETVHCPFCDNAPAWKPSLSITRDPNGLLYNCYRAICSGRGFIGSLSSVLQTRVKKKVFTPMPFTKETSYLNKTDWQRLYSKYSLTKGEIKANQLRHIENGVLLPLFNKDGYQFGNTTKYFTGLKAIHYLETDTCKLHYSVRDTRGTTVILVEDVLSAIRVNRFHQGVALLGTHLNDAMVKDLMMAGFKNVIVALDPDALSKAVEMRSKYSLFFNTFRVVSLSKDPKDLSHAKLKEELEV